MSAKMYYESPLGCLEIEGSERGVSHIRFISKRSEDSAEAPSILRECVRQLDEYFSGKRRKFSVQLDLSTATPFYSDVWKMVQAIPYGRTRTYSDIAETLDNPSATRAVGQANGNNPVPIIIPCHRVIGKSGKLTGYAYGLRVKQALLAIENPRNYAVKQADLFAV
jgi:methylated-DNA-[protein]-cysteine S-methyltransferase